MLNPMRDFKHYVDNKLTATAIAREAEEGMALAIEKLNYWQTQLMKAREVIKDADDNLEALEALSITR
jgi:hypothetical protein